MNEDNTNESQTKENLNTQIDNRKTLNSESVDAEVIKNSEPKKENAGSEKVLSETEAQGENSSSRIEEYFSETIETQSAKMNNVLSIFHELKKIDEELTEIEDEKGDLPGDIESIKNKINLLNTEIDEKNQSLLKLEEEKSKLDNDNSSYEEKINKYDEQKFNVRSNKEYDEIVKAIDSLFEEVKKNETRLKDIKSIAEMLSSDVEAVEVKSVEFKTELSEKETLLNELDEQYKQDESSLKEKRGELVSKLDSVNLSLYERINSSHKGEATAIVRKGNCSGCYNSIPPQRVIEIKTAEKVFLCQSCGRILIAEELINP